MRATFFFAPSNYPCFCLCFGFVQITITEPLRRMILQRSQRGFTEVRIFITDIEPPEGGNLRSLSQAPDLLPR
jgi:hypothetical protein